MTINASRPKYGMIRSMTVDTVSSEVSEIVEAGMYLISSAFERHGVFTGRLSGILRYSANIRTSLKVKLRRKKQAASLSQRSERRVRKPQNFWISETSVPLKMGLASTHFICMHVGVVFTARRNV